MIYHNYSKIIIIYYHLLSLYHHLGLWWHIWHMDLLDLHHKAEKIRYICFKSVICGKFLSQTCQNCPLILLCLMQYNFTCQGRASGWERVNRSWNPMGKRLTARYTQGLTSQSDETFPKIRAVTHGYYKDINPSFLHNYMWYHRSVPPHLSRIGHALVKFDCFD